MRRVCLEFLIIQIATEITREVNKCDAFINSIRCCGHRRYRHFKLSIVYCSLCFFLYFSPLCLFVNKHVIILLFIYKVCAFFCLMRCEVHYYHMMIDDAIDQHYSDFFIFFALSFRLLLFCRCCCCCFVYDFGLLLLFFPIFKMLFSFVSFF